MADLVPSPLHRALSELSAAVQRGCGTVASALSGAEKQMAGGDGEVWTGPTARQWASELSGRSTDLSRQANQFTDDIRRELARQPEQVTADEARTEARMLTGRI